MGLDEISDRYRVLDQLGAGGFGAVHRAEQVSTGQVVAIKVLHGDARSTADDAARFHRELKIVAGLNHPNIVRLLDSGPLGTGGRYIVFEFVDGESLADRLRRGPLPIGEAKRLMAQVLDALGCAHAAGVVHRDIKPQNIMLTGTGLRTNAQLLDFGIAGVDEARRDADYDPLTRDGEAPGTLCYSAPEQLRGQLSPQADLFAWGLVFVECLTGRRVLSGRLQSDVLRQLLGPAPIALPDDFAGHPIASVLATALNKNPAQRFSSADAALQALEACPLDGLEVEAAVLADTAAATDPQPAVTTSHHMSGEALPEPAPTPTRWALPALVAVALIGVVAFMLTRPSLEPHARSVPPAPSAAPPTQTAHARHTSAVLAAVRRGDFPGGEAAIRGAWADPGVERTSFNAWLHAELALAPLRAHPSWQALFPPLDAAVAATSDAGREPRRSRRMKPKPAEPTRRAPPTDDDWKRFH